MDPLPPQTTFGRRIAKQKLYDKLPWTPALKRSFGNQVRSIVWRNKLAPDTLRIAKGAAVEEVEVFEISLTGDTLHPDILRLMESQIPYRILFLLEYQGKYQARISFKGPGADGAMNRVCYNTDGWQDLAELPCRIQGLTMDAVYENLVRQVAGPALPPPSEGENEPLATTIWRAQERAKLTMRINALERKLHREKQFNRQVELNAELKKLKKELANLQS